MEKFWVYLRLSAHPEAKTLRKTNTLDMNDGHMAIRIKDYRRARDYLIEKQVEIFENPYSISGFSQIFCHDPDGNLIELNVDPKDLNI